MTFRLWRCFTCSLKTLGHKLSDEVLGSPLASILFNRRPLEICLLVGHHKNAKKAFFAFGQITRDLKILSHNDTESFDIAQ